MTGAHFKTLRESLSLPLQFIADAAGVRLRTAQYWESGDKDIPDDVEALICSINEHINEIVANTIAFIGGGVESIVFTRFKTVDEFWRYHPEFKPLLPETHAVIFARVIELLAPEIEASIIWFDEDDYLAWLGNRKHSSTLLAEWGSTK